MIKKQTWIILIVSLVLVGAFILLQQKEWLDFMTKKDDEPTATPMPTFITLDSNALEILRFTAQGEDEVVLTKTGEDAWEISTEDGAITAGNIEEIVSEFNAIRTASVLSLDMEGSSVGLNTPRYVFFFEMEGGAKKLVKIGNTNPMDSAYYAQVDAGQIVLISKGGIDNIVSVITTAATPPTPTPEPTETPSE